MQVGASGRTSEGGWTAVGDLVAALFSPPPPGDVFGPVWLIYLLVFGAGFVLSVAAEGDGLARVLPHPAARRVVARYARPAAVLFGAGLFSFGVRALQIDPFRFAAPIWLLLCLVAVLVYLVWAWGRLRREIPAAVAATDRARDSGGGWPAAPPRGPEGSARPS